MKDTSRLTQFPRTKVSLVELLEAQDICCMSLHTVSSLGS